MHGGCGRLGGVGRFDQLAIMDGRLVETKRNITAKGPDYGKQAFTLSRLTTMDWGIYSY